MSGIPTDARAGKAHGFLRPEQISDAKLAQVRALSVIAKERGQSLASMAIAWVLRDKRVTSAIIGASKISQLEQCVAAASSDTLTSDELKRIDAILAG